MRVAHVMGMMVMMEEGGESINHNFLPIVGGGGGV